MTEFQASPLSRLRYIVQENQLLDQSRLASSQALLDSADSNTSLRLEGNDVMRPESEACSQNMNKQRQSQS
jgi:hypothetical protein